MRGLFYILFFLPFVCAGQLTAEQYRQVDSLKRVIKTARHDTTIVSAWKTLDDIIYISDPDLDLRLNRQMDSLCVVNLKKTLPIKTKNTFLKLRSGALNNLGNIYFNTGDYTSSYQYYMQSLGIRKKLADKNGIASCLSNIGILKRNQGNYTEAIKYYTQSLAIFKKMGDKTGISNTLTSIGNVFNDQGDFAKAIDYYNQSLKIIEQTGDKYGMATTLSNIGSIYKELGEYSKAIDYYNQGLKIRQQIGDKRGIAASYNNIGIIHLFQYDTAVAIDFYTKGLTIYEQEGDQQGIAISLNNIGTLYSEQHAYKKAMDCNTKSLHIYEALGDKEGISYSLMNLGNISYRLGNYARAIDFCTRALAVARELGTAIVTRDASQVLWEVNKKTGNYKSALEMYERYVTARDSIASDENHREVIRQQFKYKYEKQAADSVKHAALQKVKDEKIARQNAEISAKRKEQYMLYGGLGLVAVFSLFIFNRFRVTNRQKKIIETQKEEVELQKEIVEEKNKEILDSISYAKRIQQAILPPAKIVKEYLRDSFILYKPKDIVAGDFYWMETAGDTILFAACDCTGHGVPGALVSVICNNGLNRAVKEYQLTKPGLILDKTRELVIQEFEKSEEDVKDGMDISLCAMTVKGSTLRVEWAGANNPLWLIRNGEIIEHKPNKQPIGKYADPKPFTTHEIACMKGDTLYLFTDGLQDQFGGERGKKFKAAKFKELLLSVQEQSMHQQQKTIDETFEAWKQGLEQNDDVCVIGVRL